MGRVDENNKLCEILDKLGQESWGHPELANQQSVALYDMYVLIDISKSLAVIADSLNVEELINKQTDYLNGLEPGTQEEDES